MKSRLICFVMFYSILQETEEIIQNNKLSHHQILDREQFINKVSLTQIDYIQFLKYTSDVPSITEYTFCIWLKSNNLTHKHPILSYSKAEEERLIRVWIGPNGKNINLEIEGTLIFNIPVNMIENRWYHICQSWSSFRAVWVLYLNGKIKSSGSHPKLKASFIKGGGDIVVGQEYTDFDKGLDDGIEGDITGFNFVLSATTDREIKPPPRRKYPVSITKNNKTIQTHMISSQYIPFKPTEFANYKTITNEFKNYKTIPNEIENDELESTGYEVNEPIRDPKGMLDLFKNIFHEHHPPRVRIVQKRQPVTSSKLNNRRSTQRFAQNEIGEVKKSLGKLLVELSFDCGYRKGAPLTGRGVLINWTQSPVRVFGGATLKSIPAFCYESSVQLAIGF